MNNFNTIIIQLSSIKIEFNDDIWALPLFKFLSNLLPLVSRFKASPKVEISHAFIYNFFSQDQFLDAIIFQLGFSNEVVCNHSHNFSTIFMSYFFYFYCLLLFCF